MQNRNNANNADQHKNKYPDFLQLVAKYSNSDDGDDWYDSVDAIEQRSHRKWQNTARSEPRWYHGY